MFSGLLKIEFTYPLSHDDHRENVSVQRLVKNRIHVHPSKPGRPWGECQRSFAREKIEFTYSLNKDSHGENVNIWWLVKNRIHVLSKVGQAWEKCQCSVAREKSNSRTL